MSRKGKKGFQRLEDHELTEFTSLQKSGSDSEVELDLRPSDIDQEDGRYGGGGASSLCCWLLGLYLAILTILLILMAICTAYVTVNFMHSQKDMLDVHNDMNSRIETLQTKLDTVNKNWSRWSTALMVSMAMNNVSVFEELNQLRQEFHRLDLRVTAIESKPEEKLVKELEEKMAALNKSMTVLNKSTSLLNRSLSDVQEIKTRMASLKSIIDSYDSQFREVHRNLGDVEHQRKQLEDELDSLSSDVADVKAQLRGMQDSVSKSHGTMDQSVELLSSQFQNLQVLVSTLNTSTSEEMEQVWDDMSVQKLRIEALTINVTAVSEDVNTLTSQIAEMLQSPGTSTPETQGTPEPETEGEPTTEPSAQTPQPTEGGGTLNATTEVSTQEPATLAPAQNQTEAPTTPSTDHLSEPLIDNVTISITEGTAVPTGVPSSESGNGTVSTEATEDIPVNEGDESGSGGGKGGDGEDEGVTNVTPSSSPVSTPPESTSATEDDPIKQDANPSSATDSLPGGNTTASNVTELTPAPPNTNDSRTNATEAMAAPGASPSPSPSADDDETSTDLKGAIAVLEGLLKDFDRTDVDKDGFLSLHEFMYRFPEGQEIFSTLNVVQDSGLSREEIMASLTLLKGAMR